MTNIIDPSDLASALIEDEGLDTYNNPFGGGPVSGAPVVPNTLDADAPPAEVITAWKERFGQVFRVEVAGKAYYVTPLLHGQWKDLRSWADSQQKSPYDYEFHEKVVGQCLLHPLPDPRLGGWNASPAGLVESLSLAIQDCSLFAVPGYSDPDRIRVTELFEPPPAAAPTPEELDAIRQNVVLPTAVVTLGAEVRVVRGLTRAEVRDILANNEGPDIQDAAVIRGLVWPTKDSVNFDRELGGMLLALFQEIDNLSLNPFARIFGGQFQQPKVTAL